MYISYHFNLFNWNNNYLSILMFYKLSAIQYNPSKINSSPFTVIHGKSKGYVFWAAKQIIYMLRCPQDVNSFLIILSHILRKFRGKGTEILCTFTMNLSFPIMINVKTYSLIYIYKLNPPYQYNLYFFIDDVILPWHTFCFHFRFWHSSIFDLLILVAF